MSTMDVVLQKVIDTNLNNEEYYFTLFNNKVYIYKKDNDDVIDELFGEFDLPKEIIDKYDQYITNSENKELLEELINDLTYLLKVGITNVALKDNKTFTFRLPPIEELNIALNRNYNWFKK